MISIEIIFDWNHLKLYLELFINILLRKEIISLSSIFFIENLQIFCYNNLILKQFH